MSVRDGFLLVLSAVVWGGCAAGGGTLGGRGAQVQVGSGWGSKAGASNWVESNATTVRVLDFPQASVWAVVQAAYHDLEIPVTQVSVVTRELHTVGSWVRRLAGGRVSNFFDCGEDQFGPFADQFDVRLNMRTAVVQRDTDSTELVMDVHASAQRRGGVGEPVPCVSRGRLEDRLKDEIEDLLGVLERL